MEKAERGMRVFRISKMNKNPGLYKYYWRVVAKKDLPDDLQVVKFISFPVGASNIPMSSCISVESKKQDSRLRSYIVENSQRVCLFDALKRMAELDANDQQYVAINVELPRLGTPFNPKHEKWKDREFALAFDDDTDPDVDSHK